MAIAKISSTVLGQGGGYTPANIPVGRGSSHQLRAEIDGFVPDDGLEWILSYPQRGSGGRDRVPTKCRESEYRETGSSGGQDSVNKKHRKI